MFCFKVMVFFFLESTLLRQNLINLYKNAPIGSILTNICIHLCNHGLRWRSGHFHDHEIFNPFEAISSPSTQTLGWSLLSFFFSPNRLILSFLDFHMSEIIELYTFISSFSYSAKCFWESQVLCVSTTLSFFLLSNISFYGDTCFVYPVTSRWILSWLPFLGIMNKAALNVLTRACVDRCIHFSWVNI